MIVVTDSLQGLFQHIALERAIAYSLNLRGASEGNVIIITVCTRVHI